MAKPTQPPKPNDARDARLKAALKANLARRKAQARARAGDGTAQSEKTTGDRAGSGN